MLQGRGGLATSHHLFGYLHQRLTIPGCGAADGSAALPRRCAVALGLLCRGASGGVVALNVPTDYSSGGFYRYCPATLVEGGVRHVFYCKNTTANQIVDSIYHATVDAAGNLSGESAVLDPADSTSAAWDSGVPAVVPFWGERIA